MITKEICKKRLNCINFVVVLIFTNKSIYKYILTCKNWSWLQTTIIILGSENLAGWIRTRESNLDPVFSDLSGTRYSPKSHHRDIFTIHVANKTLTFDFVLKQTIDNQFQLTSAEINYH